jgi:hypothetical protein
VAISQSVIGGPEAAAIRLKCQRPAAKRSEGANRAADEESFCAQSNGVPESAAAASFAAASRSVIDETLACSSSRSSELEGERTHMAVD